MKKLIIIFLLIFFFIPINVFAQEEVPSVQKDSFYKAKVQKIIKEEQIEDFGRVIFDQEITAKLQTGPDKGEIKTFHNEFTNGQESRRLKKGDVIVVGQSLIGEEQQYHVTDVYRLNSLVWVLLFFVIVTILFTRSKGIRAFIGLAATFLVIFYFLIPQIISGANPFWAAVLSVIVIASSALFIAHGVNIRTTIAFVSTLFTVILSVLLSNIFVNLGKLSGLGTEEAFYLQFAEIGTINIKGLLLAGIIIGTLGVLDDITTAQTAVVEELAHANKSFKMKELYKRGLSVGREHIISLVNTLVLAYTGAALPLLLLFKIYSQPFWVTLNSEVVVEEIIRMLVGSTSLILAVPLTTFFAAWMFGGSGKEFIKKYNHLAFFKKSEHYHTH